MGWAALGGPGPQRRILLAGLTEGDTRRLEVFLLVNSSRLHEHWCLVGEGPADVYLYDADEPPTVPGVLDQAPYPVRVVDAGRNPGPPDLTTLWRPLQYDDFVDILAAVEQGTPTSARAAAMPVNRSTAPTRFRLRRWPGTALLDAIPHGMRMASFITVRYLSAEELSSLSGVAPDGCHRFLMTMKDHRLLRAEPTDSAPAPVMPRPMTGPGARPDRRLLASLRARLGIALGGP